MVTNEDYVELLMKQLYISSKFINYIFIKMFVIEFRLFCRSFKHKLHG